MRSKYVLTGFLLFLYIFSLPLYGAAQENSTEYLKYQEPQSQVSATSWLSTITYVISLLATFAAVICLAFFTSQFLGKRLGKFSSNHGNKVIATLPLGNNRAIYVVEVAGKFLVLGVTDQNITLLQEITNEAEIEKMYLQGHSNSEQDQFQNVFQRHLASLQQISQKVPLNFETHKQDNGHEKR